MAAVGEEKHFVAFDDYGVGGGDDEAVVAVNGADLAVHAFGQVAVHRGDGAADQKAAAVRLYHGHAGFVVGKAQHLQGAGVAQQGGDAFGYELFGVDGVGYGEGVEHAIVALAV